MSLFFKAGAECFATPMKNEWWRRDFHQVVTKEDVHHLDERDRVKIFSGMRQDLHRMEDNELSSLLIITQPQYDHDYPLPAEPRQVWVDNQPSLSQIEGESKEAGFCNIRHSVEAYPCSTPLSRWLAMIQTRF